MRSGNYVMLLRSFYLLTPPLDRSKLSLLGHLEPVLGNLQPSLSCQSNCGYARLAAGTLQHSGNRLRGRSRLTTLNYWIANKHGGTLGLVKSCTRRRMQGHDDYLKPARYS